MEAVKVKLYQNLVNYRRELSFGYVQTYPLPTPSMVRGMVHTLLDFTEYHNLKISIQGCYDTIVTNMQKVYKFDRVRDDRKKGIVDPRFRLKAGGTQKTLNTGVMYVDLIYNLYLILHIALDEEKYHKSLMDAFSARLVLLGRNEDIARVDDICLTAIHETEVEEFTLKNNMYLTGTIPNGIRGTAYRLPFYYKPVKDITDKRIFSFVDVLYVAKESSIEEHDIMVDDDGDIVDFMEITI